MILLVGNVKTELLEHQFHVILPAAQEVPTRTAMKALGVRLQPGRFIRLRIDRNRQDTRVLAEPAAEPLRNTRQVSSHSRTAILAGREHDIDDDHLAPQEVAMEAVLRASLIDQNRIGKILASRSVLDGLLDGR